MRQVPLAGYERRNFRGIDQKYVHDGFSRKKWVSSVLEELNNAPEYNADLPPEGIKRTIEYLLDPVHFIDRDLPQMGSEPAIILIRT